MLTKSWYDNLLVHEILGICLPARKGGPCADSQDLMDQVGIMAAMSERMVKVVAPGVFAILAPTFPASGIKKERVSNQSRGATTSEQSLGGQRDSLIPGPFWERQIKRMMWSHH